MALIAVSAATIITIRILEPDDWAIGLFAPPTDLVRELLFGVAFAALLIGTCDLVLILAGITWLAISAIRREPATAR